MAQLTMEEITATLNPKVSYLDMAGIKQTQLEAVHLHLDITFIPLQLNAPTVGVF